MRKILPLIALSLAFLVGVGCTPTDKGDGAPGQNTLTVDEKELVQNFTVSGSVAYVTVKSAAAFTATSSAPEWCTTQISSNTGSRNLAIITTKNTDVGVRSATVTLRSEGVPDAVIIQVKQLGESPAILVKEKRVAVAPAGAEFTIEVTANVEVSFVLPTWVSKVEKSKAMVTRDYTFLGTALPLSENSRKGEIVVNGAEGVTVSGVTVSVVQERSSNVDPEEFPADTKVKIVSVDLVHGTQQNQTGAESVHATIDGDYATFYHSSWSGMAATDSSVLEYVLQGPSSVDYFNIVPRSSHSNGVFQTGKIYVKTSAKPTWHMVSDFDFGGVSNSPQIIKMASRLVGVTAVRLRADAAKGGDKPYVTMSEFECFLSNSEGLVSQYEKYFTDKSFSELAPGVTLEQINAIDNVTVSAVARQLFEKTYPEFRLTVAEAYRPIDDLSKELKTSTYNRFENPTGIYFKANEDVVIFVGPTNGEKVTLQVVDFNSNGQPSAVYALNEGVNRIKVKQTGSGYIPYYTKNYKTAKDIRVNITNATVTGYFDTKKHTNEDYARILKAAVSPVFDARGEHCQIVFHTDRFRAGCPSDGQSLLAVYDSVVRMEWRLMGLYKYNRIPKNRMFVYVAEGAGTAAAGGWGALFPPSWTGTQTNAQELINTSWGLAHELGHVNQVRPAMNFTGTTEVTNNIYSSWVQWNFTPGELRLEHESINGLDGLGNITGGRFNAFLNSGIVKKQIWMNQDGPDRSNAIKEGTNTTPPTVTGADFFVRLVPLWQLQLYFHVAGEGNSWHKPFFWADVFEKVRVEVTNSSNTYNMLQMMKNICDATQTDLSDFFAKTGILRTRDLIQDDYSPARLTITAADSASVVQYASQYAKPATDYIYYLSGNTVNCYKNQLSVVAGTVGQGVTMSGERAIISHATWKNAVVFEAYKGAELQKIAMAGTGTKTNSQTSLSYPSGCTRIEAVAWNGVRTLVYGTR